MSGSKKAVFVSKPKRRKTTKHRQFLNEHRHLYEAMFKEQGGVCYLCGRPPKVRKLNMDHDHKRMVVRGLLCSLCNRGLHSWMTREWLHKAADYVNRSVYSG